MMASLKLSQTIYDKCKTGEAERKQLSWASLALEARVCQLHGKQHQLNFHQHKHHRCSIQGGRHPRGPLWGINQLLQHCWAQHEASQVSMLQKNLLLFLLILTLLFLWFDLVGIWWQKPPHRRELEDLLEEDEVFNHNFTAIVFVLIFSILFVNCYYSNFSNLCWWIADLRLHLCLPPFGLPGLHSAWNKTWSWELLHKVFVNIVVVIYHHQNTSCGKNRLNLWSWTGNRFEIIWSARQPLSGLSSGQIRQLSLAILGSPGQIKRQMKAARNQNWCFY